MVTQSFEQVYQVVEAFQDLAEGLGPLAKKGLSVLVEMLLENEREAEKLAVNFDWDKAKQIYDNRTFLLAESYDFLRASAN